MDNINFFNKAITTNKFKTAEDPDERKLIDNNTNIQNFDIDQARQFRAPSNTNYFSWMFCTSNNDNEENSHPVANKDTDVI